MSCFALIFFAGQKSLIEMNPNVTLVDTPHDTPPSALSVPSLIPNPYTRETKGAPNPMMRGQLKSVPQRVSAAAMLHPPHAEKLFPEQIESPSNLQAPPVMGMATAQLQFSRPGLASSESELRHSFTDELPAPSTEPLPRSDVSIPGQQPSSRSPAELGMKSRTVQVEGVDEEWDTDDYEMAFNDEEKGGGEIEEHGIVLKGSTAYVTFKDPIGEKMRIIDMYHRYCIQHQIVTVV